MATVEEKGAVRPALATVKEASEYLRVSRAKLYTMMDRGDLRHVKIGASRRLRWDDIDGLIAQSTIE